MWAYQNIFSRMEHGTPDEVLEELADVNIGYWMGNRGFREWWQTEHKTPYTPDFEAVVDRIVAGLEAESSSDALPPDIEG